MTRALIAEGAHIDKMGVVGNLLLSVLPMLILGGNAEFLRDGESFADFFSSFTH